MTTTSDVEKQIKKDISGMAESPAKFVHYAYPWQKKNTILEDETGPDKWQSQILKDIGHAIRHGFVYNNGEKKLCSNGKIWIAVRSGHGIGKSTLMAWLDQWFLSTHPSPQCITTANTETQLLHKTWREMSKWHDLMINKKWFDWTATRFICKAKPETWYSQAVSWSKSNPQAFAGTHEKYVMMKFDEASEIDDTIWEVTEGAMTDSKGLKIWIVFGNPTQNTGRFYECFNKQRSRWLTYEVDARDSNRTDKKLIQEQIDLYGEDSDFVRVRIKGQEPRSGSNQMIPTATVEKAKGRIITIDRYIHAPKILGVDIARFGKDRTVIVKRQGFACYGLQKFRGLDGPTVAGIVAQEINKWNPDAVFLDMGSYGAIVWDILVNSWNHKIVTGVNFSAAADDPKMYFNKRTEMVARVKEWLEAGGCVPDDNELRDDMTAPQYKYRLGSGKEQIQLESSEDMHARGCASPDCLMALGLTFAYEVDMKIREKANKRASVAITDYNVLDFGNQRQMKQQAVTDYDMFGYGR